MEKKGQNQRNNRQEEAHRHSLIHKTVSKFEAFMEKKDQNQHKKDPNSAHDGRINHSEIFGAVVSEEL